MSPVPFEDVRAVGPMRIVLTTYPSRDAALAAIESTLRARLAVCANVVPVLSRYWWNDRVEAAEESLVVFKTAPKRVGVLFRHLEATHPYDVPEIVEVDVPRVGSRYLDYLVATLEAGPIRPVRRGAARRRGGPQARGVRVPARTRAPRRPPSR